METWLLITVTVCLAALLKAFITLGKPKSKKLPVPPGPKGIPIITRIIWLRKSFTEMEASIRTLHAKYGPVVSLPIATRPAIFIASHELAHQALVHQGAVFADRPKPLPTSKIISSNQHNISSAHYGSKWRLLRRNLTSQILHPSKVKAYSHARKWVLEILVNQLGASGSDAVDVVEHFRFAMFCLLVLMCFGDKLSEDQIREILTVQRHLLVSFRRFQVLNLWPWVTKYVFRSRWEELFSTKKKQEEILLPLIRARKQQQEQKMDDRVTSYADTLLSLELDDESGSSEAKRKLSEEQIISACSEFLDAGTDTTSTALQWIMASLVKYPEIQENLYQEIKGTVGQTAGQVEEDELSKMPYLKAVVLEGLRRHSPAHFVLPHTLTEEAELGGYTIPKDAVVNFMVAEMGLNPKVWDDPLTFKPERFMSTTDTSQEFDITGSREIKMMPFGVGRRICPGFGLAMLHLEYFVANLVLKFKWEAADGYEVDLSEKQEFTVVMKNPLQARISPREKVA